MPSFIKLSAAFINMNLPAPGMIEAFIPLFQPIQQEYAKGLESVDALRHYTGKAHTWLERVSAAVEQLEKTGWKWHTTYESIVLFKELPTAAAAEELLASGLQEGEFHFGYPG